MEHTYRIHVAAEMTGVSEPLIRAWERRYGVLNPKRTSSGYRAYTEADIAVLKRLKQLTTEGVSIGDAVALLPQLKREAREALEAHPAPRRASLKVQLARWTDSILAAADRLDQQAVEAVLDEAMGALPPLTFFDELLAPLQQEVGARWHSGRITVAEEHLVTQAARQRVLALLHQAPRRTRAHVICACFPQEDHELGLMGVALRFRHAGWRVTFLGARTPAEHLARVVQKLGPELVAVSTGAYDREAAFQRALLEVLEPLPEGTRVVVGGPSSARFPTVVKRAGALLAETADAWDQLLSVER